MLFQPRTLQETTSWIRAIKIQVEEVEATHVRIEKRVKTQFSEFDETSFEWFNVFPFSEFLSRQLTENSNKEEDASDSSGDITSSSREERKEKKRSSGSSGLRYHSQFIVTVDSKVFIHDFNFSMFCTISHPSSIHLFLSIFFLHLNPHNPTLPSPLFSLNDSIFSPSSSFHPLSNSTTLVFLKLTRPSITKTGCC
jgi:hypothetical protein